MNAFWAVREAAHDARQRLRSEKWLKTYGGAGVDRGFAAVETPDGGFVIARVTGSEAQSNGLVLKVGADGTQVWRQTLEANRNVIPHFINLLANDNLPAKITGLPPEMICAAAFGWRVIAKGLRAALGARHLLTSMRTAPSNPRSICSIAAKIATLRQWLRCAMGI